MRNRSSRSFPLLELAGLLVATFLILPSSPAAAPPMAHDPDLHVMAADGYYEKLYFWPAFTFSQFDLNPEICGRVEIETYESGHMMDIHEPSLAKMEADMAALFQRALDPRQGH